MLVNDTVNIGGSTFLHRLREETGASLEEIVRAHAAAREIFGVSGVWDAVEALDNKVAADVQTRIRLHSRRLVERGTRWLLNNRPQPLPDRRDDRGLLDRRGPGLGRAAEPAAGRRPGVVPGHPATS